MSEQSTLDTIKDTAGSLLSVPGRILDTAMWFSPPVLLIMFVNMILLIVVIVKIVSRLTEKFATGNEKMTMYYRQECGYCEQDMPFFLQLAKKYQSGVTFELHDTSQKPVTGISAVPTYIYTLSDGTKMAHQGAFGSFASMEANFRSVFGVDNYEALQAMKTQSLPNGQ